MKNKLYQIISSLIILIATVITIVLMINRNILPMKYIGIISGILVVILILLIIWLFMSKSITSKVITSFIFIMLIFIYGYGLTYQEKATSVITNITKEAKYETYTYSFIVLKDKSEDLNTYNGHRIGTMRNFSESDNLINTELSKLIPTPYFNDYTDINLMVNDFYNGNMSSLLLDKSYLDMVNENDESFESKTKIIWTKEIKIKVDDISKKVDITKEPFIMFISGIDTYGPISSLARSDVNIIMAINPNTYEILLVHIPRDYYVNSDNNGDVKDKLTHTGAFGINLTVKTVEQFMGININYYTKINFNTLVNLVDVLGGINVYSDFAFQSWGYYFNQGYNSMDGKKALVFSRDRLSFTPGKVNGGDRIRGKHQEAVLTAIIEKISSPSVITKVDSILNVMSKSFVTNLNSKDVTNFINMELNKMPNWNIKSISLDGTDLATLGTPFYPNDYIYVMVPNQATIDNAKAEINRVLGK